MPNRVVVSIAVCLLACAAQRPYEGPAVGARTASLRLEPVDTAAYFESATTALLHVYDTGDACPRAALDRASPAYRGLVDASLLRNTLTIPAGGFVFFSFEIRAVLPRSTWRCEVPFGFRPQPGVAYTLEITIADVDRCLLDLYDDASRRLPLTSPETCEPWWEGGEAASPP